MTEYIHVEKPTNGNRDSTVSSFVYNDRCSLVLLMDDETTKEGRKEEDKSKNKNSVNNCEGMLDNGSLKSNENFIINGLIKMFDKEKTSSDKLNMVNRELNKNDDESNVENAQLEDYEKKDKDKKNEQVPFKSNIKLQVGLDYSNFELDTPYKIIKFINKGCHFLYWSSDVLFNENSKISKEFIMNEMKKNNCEEIRNSRFLYFDIEKKLLVLKYDKKNNNFTYVGEDDFMYKYFFHLHEKDFLDETIIKEKKSSILIYPYTYTKIWKSLTSYINEEVIDKIEPVNKTFCSSFLKEVKEKNDLFRDEEMNLYNQPYMFYSVIPKYTSGGNYRKKLNILRNHKKEDSVKEEETRDIAKDVAEKELEELDEEPVEELSEEQTESGLPNDYCANKSYFECIHIDNKHKKYVPTDLTMKNLEKYWILKEIIQQEYTYIYYDNEKQEGFRKFENKLFYILGEFQFAFILFHLGFNYQSFLQWKKLFELVSNSQHLISNFADFFEEVLKVIFIHLNYLSDDFFDNAENSFILFGIYNIYEIISNLEDVNVNIVKLVDSIDTIIYAKLGLHLPDLSFVYEEFQPTYVDDD
ncbi:AAR2 protein [Plasmodium brasilianum]|uniref:AAR2 protein, putative n=2 Tax=Plasmodium (Plasmodium) TaxID=418103 RepID=A0A1D3TDX3_PLAMA|nr:AAR2 protein, putative [Plasmodium malariae]KAI4834627.1 AAR2 protein [Plasmodium brasilianum]SCP03167.1 AAR2 protein, putative [Plasmodium malariae]